MLTKYLVLLQENKNYRYLWWGNVISLFGDWFNLIASAALISLLTEATTAISYLFLARFLPLFFFSPFAGVLADRYDRRNIMIASDVLRGLTVLGFLLIRDPSQIWLFYLLTISQFALSSLFTPARSAIIAMVVAEEDLVAANALDSLTWSSMLALGSLAGGFVSEMFGNDTAFFLDALTFFLSGWVISLITLPAKEEVPEVSQGGFFDFVDGLRYLWGVPILLIISMVKGGGSLVWGSINVLEVAVAEDIFPLGDGGALTLGWFYALSGIGTGLSPILFTHLLGEKPAQLRRGITIGFVLMTVGILILGLAPNLAMYSLGTLIRTSGTGVIWVFTAVLLQMSVPNHVRGRVFAFEFAFLTLMQSVSIYWAGFAPDYLGFSIQQTILSMAVLGMVIFLVWVLFQYRTGKIPLVPEGKKDNKSSLVTFE
ncbi:MAG TPA: MFS transporter [Anaerolineae bacterium]|nr:MFS transporter [Anaerolineae bacterium]